jgi:long-chain acyl-CoA synthetase
VPGADLDAESVIDHLRGRLADFKIPQFLVVRSTPLPRNPGGKLLKRPLREGTEWGKPLHGR